MAHTQRSKHKDIVHNTLCWCFILRVQNDEDNAIAFDGQSRDFLDSFCNKMHMFQSTFAYFSVVYCCGFYSSKLIWSDQENHWQRDKERERKPAKQSNGVQWQKYTFWKWFHIFYKTFDMSVCVFLFIRFVFKFKNIENCEFGNNNLRKFSARMRLQTYYIWAKGCKPQTKHTHTHRR